MNETGLLTLIRTALLAEMPGVEVRQNYNPLTVGVPSGPTVFLSIVVPARRVGWVGRRETLVETEDAFRHDEVQWLETTIQVSALAKRDPGAADYLAQPTAGDLCRLAADILQGDRGMAVLSAQRVRPLRIAEVRNAYFINDSDQHEANPSFDVVLSHVQIRTSATPAASEVNGRAGRV